ncbi:MAG TPA: hypothetical protein VNS62_03530 [Candidatus Udaeobacter sp.]|nr:hypothetical protein [Candidatus Udaeobacter sp.]
MVDRRAAVIEQVFSFVALAPRVGGENVPSLPLPWSDGVSFLAALEAVAIRQSLEAALPGLLASGVTKR